MLILNPCSISFVVDQYEISVPRQKYGYYQKNFTFMMFLMLLSSDRTRWPKTKSCRVCPACHRLRSSQPRSFRTRWLCRVSRGRPTRPLLGWAPEHFTSLMNRLCSGKKANRHVMPCFCSFGTELSQDKARVLKSKFMFRVSLNIFVIRSDQFTRVCTSDAVSSVTRR